MVVLDPLNTLVERCLRDLVEVSHVCQMDHEPIRIVTFDSVASIVGKECFNMIVSEVVERRHCVDSAPKVQIERQEKLVMDSQFVRRLQILSHDLGCAFDLRDQFLVSPYVCLDLRDDLRLQLLPVLRHPRPVWQILSWKLAQLLTLVPTPLNDLENVCVDR